MSIAFLTTRPGTTTTRVRRSPVTEYGHCTVCGHPTMRFADGLTVHHDGVPSDDHPAAH